MKNTTASKLIIDAKILQRERVPGPGPRSKERAGMLTWCIPVPWRKTPLRIWANRDTIFLDGAIECPGVDLPRYDNETRRITYEKKLGRHHVIDGTRVPDALQFLDQRPHDLKAAKYSGGGPIVHDGHGGRMCRFVGADEALLVRRHSLQMVRAATGRNWTGLHARISDSLQPTLLLFRKLSKGHRLVAAMTAASQNPKCRT